MAVNVNLRAVKHSDLEEVRGWLLAEGWMASSNVIEATYQWDSTGWLVAEDEQGQLVGSLTICMLGHGLAFGGLLIVHPAYRNKGITLKLWDEIVPHLADTNVGLNSVENLVAMYTRHGFQCQSFRMAKCVGALKREKIITEDCEDVEFVNYSGGMLPELAIYDATIHQVERKVFLRQFLKPDVTTTLVAKRHGSIIGYGSIQPVDGNMQHVGPVFAEEVRVGRTLCNRLFDLVPDQQKVHLDLVLENPLRQELMETHDLQELIRVTRMYTKAVVPCPIDKVFAMTTMNVSLV